MTEGFVFPNINALLDHLKSEHDAKHVYRGQGRDYGSLFPSRYRPFVEDIDEDGYASLRRSRLIAERSLRTTEIDKLRSHLVSKYGPALGNLMCQQYAIYSTIIDVTSEPDVAGFFASRKWPGCVHIDEADDPGVIYRWNRSSLPTDQMGPHNAQRTGRILSLDGEGEREVAFMFAPPRSPEAEVLLESPNGVLAIAPDIIAIDDIRLMVEGLTLGETDARAAPADRIESVWSGLRTFDQSRWAAQQGGLLRPEAKYECYRFGREWTTVTKDRNESYETRSDAAYIDEPFQVRDALKSPRADHFYFRQSPQRVEFEPQALWPSPAKDRLFMAVCNLIWIANSDFLKATRVNTPWDRYGGLLDRGTYSEDYTKGEYEEYAEWCEVRGLTPDPRES